MPGLMRSTFYFVKTTFKDGFKLARRPTEAIKSLYEVSLYRNAVYLMLNSGVTAVLGFLFWILVARLYSPEDVGLGAALLSVVGLLSFMGTLGLGFGIIRFLPNSEDKARLLNSSFTISFLTSIVVAFIFLAGLPLWLPEVLFIRENTLFFFAFIVFVAAATLSAIMTQTFLGFRRAEFTLAQGIIVDLARLPLVVAFAAIFGAFGIFASWGLGVAISLVTSLFLFLPQLLQHYRPFPSFEKQVTNEMVHFSFVNYIGAALGALPTWILPLMVLRLIGAEANAHFFTTWATANVLLVIPGATTYSLFAEGSHEEARLASHLRRSLKLIIVLLIPAVVFMLLFGDKLLLVFGREYSEAGTHLLWILALAAIPASINFVYFGVIRTEKRLKEIIFITAAIAFGTLLISYLLLPWFAILGTGMGWLMTSSVVALAITPRLVKRLK